MNEPYHQPSEEYEGPANGPLGPSEQNASGHHRNYDDTTRSDSPVGFNTKEPHPATAKKRVANDEKVRKSDLERSRSPIRRSRTKTRPISFTSRRTSSEPAPGSKKKGPGSRQERKAASEHLPPINLQTLRELELNEIYENGKLRHDVVFDSALHFRPNNEGSRGLKKRMEADVYWRKVYEEVMSLQNSLKEGRRTDLPPQKLPLLFHTLRDILVTLVPREDKEHIYQSLDPELMMQELSHGILDLVKYARWLATLLKAHCAPMRDQSVEQIVKTVERGAKSGDVADLVDGLRLIFLVLEAMKLDVANHQIRTLRPHLIHSAISFEQHFFQMQINNRSFDLKSPRSWYKDAFERTQATHTAGALSVHEQVFIEAATDILSPSRMLRFHQAFVFDAERLGGYRDDISDAIRLRLCALLFQQIHGATVSEDMMKKLHASIFTIIGDGSKGWMKHAEALALHLVQTSSMLRRCQLSRDNVRLAEGWLRANLLPSSKVYGLVEDCVLKDMRDIVAGTFSEWSNAATFPVGFTAEVRGLPYDVQTIGRKISYVFFMNWRVFKQAYVGAVENGISAPFDLREKHFLSIFSPTSAAFPAQKAAFPQPMHCIPKTSSPPR